MSGQHRHFLNSWSMYSFQEDADRSHNFTPSAWGILVRGEKNAAAKAAKMTQRTSAERKAAEKKALDAEPHISVSCDVDLVLHNHFLIHVHLFAWPRSRISNLALCSRLPLIVYLVLQTRRHVGRDLRHPMALVTVVCPGFVVVSPPSKTCAYIICSLHL